jgi:hypothetical protein
MLDRAVAHGARDLLELCAIDVEVEDFDLSGPSPFAGQPRTH